MKKGLALFTIASAFLISNPVNYLLESYISAVEAKRDTRAEERGSMTLYVKYNCPYCKRVLSYLKFNNIDIEIKDASIPENKAFLLANGKKTQVPCLFVDGAALYESRDIISYLMSNL